MTYTVAPPRIADDETAAETRRLVSASGSSFEMGMRLLPVPRRRAIYAVYAFSRVVDDIADGDAPPEARKQGLQDWRQELARAYDGRAQTPIGAELALAARTHDLPQAELARIVEGMQLDATPIIAPSAPELDHYIRCVAGAVGILAMRIFGGWRGEQSEEFALSLARAMQLINIIRDVSEDAAMGRLYIPRTVLATTGLPADPKAVPGHPALPEARRLLGVMARDSLLRARAEIPNHPRRAIFPALMMAGPYVALLSRMETDWSRQPPRRAGWRKLTDGLAFAIRPGR
ncbi:squalene/phytoene synthase family protein [Pseudooceanicola algae]|uniref:Presqualene diphosphate synthase n=1 Tax=Pseudooceanicola algae TaxID=1537215 RepID=A0A418SIQ8_9RHOB|nr:squalene/phytoene synthase family protein [Pseudooceanicola algae]QPM88988.1 Presqualene diphosphate synthase [Pseudooceanicola algae]